MPCLQRDGANRLKRIDSADRLTGSQISLAEDVRPIVAQSPSEEPPRS
jgi:hypothetical protein